MWVWTAQAAEEDVNSSSSVCVWLRLSWGSLSPRDRIRPLNSVTGEVKPGLNDNVWNYSTVTCMGDFQSCVLFQGKREPRDTSREGGAPLHHLTGPGLTHQKVESPHRFPSTVQLWIQCESHLQGPGTWPFNNTTCIRARCQVRTCLIQLMRLQPPALLATREHRTTIFPSSVEDDVREGGLFLGWTLSSQNHRMVWLGRDPKEQQVPTSLPDATH